MKQNQFSDVDLMFGSHPITNDVSVKRNVNAIMQSIRTICLTTDTDVPFEPNGWGDVDSLLGENSTSLMFSTIEESLSNAIRQREPRVEVVSIDVVRIADNYGVKATVKFYIVNNPEPFNVTVPLSKGG